jgi:hypothetical protein
LIDIHPDGVYHVALKQLEARVIEQVKQVVAPPREEIIEAYNLLASGQ